MLDDLEPTVQHSLMQAELLEQRFAEVYPELEPLGVPPELVRKVQQ